MPERSGGAGGTPDPVALIDTYLEKADWEVRENSNMTYSLQGLNFYVNADACRRYWLERIYPPGVREAHLGGDFHIHDLQILGTYCEGWDLIDLLTQGFRGVPDKTESKPPRHFSSALGQVVNFFYTLQGESAGAQAFSNFDTLLAPFIRYDGLNQAEVKQAIQEFVFNLNVPTRVGFQAPFTNLTFDLKPPAFMVEQGVIIGGELRAESYGDFQPEMDMLNRAFFEVMLEGDARGRAFTFPIPTYSVTRDFDWEDERFDGLWEMSAKYGIPYFANFVNSELSPDDVRSMCCRLRLDTRKLERRGGGYFASNPLTGSIGVVTLNLPRLGHLAAGEAEFMERLGALMELARESLEVKRRAIEGFMEQGLYPYSRFYLRLVRQRFGQYWKNHFSTIGLIGMHEACQRLLGAGIGDGRGRRFALDVLDFVRDRLIAFQEETGNNYNLEATPAESACYRLLRCDRERYPEMFADGPPGEGCYTNSTQLPADHGDDPFAALEHQDALQVKYTGGTVLHFYLGERVTDIQALKRFIRQVCTRYRLPYFTITPTFSVCPVHGFMTGEHERCPIGGEICEVYSRVVGYLRPTRQWNPGKQAEFRRRRPFRLK